MVPADAFLLPVEQSGFRVRLGPDVRNTGVTGTCVVRPSTLAAMAPLLAMRSPSCSASASAVFWSEGARLPNRPSTGST